MMHERGDALTVFLHNIIFLIVGSLPDRNKNNPTSVDMKGGQTDKRTPIFGPLAYEREDTLNFFIQCIHFFILSHNLIITK